MNPVRQALVFGIILFAYSTVLGWAYYGERCVKATWMLTVTNKYLWWTEKM